jgi:hypothetical protein
MQLPKFRPKTPPNLTDIEFSALQSLRAPDDIVIKPADNRGCLGSLQGRYKKALKLTGNWVTPLFTA